ncbi:MAG: helix-turn-helix domain-containing protein [Candidatus Kerfeldbacteria bacterium]|nr:helix-turn-helix domain-containing protein [Candidatus Kerfeldbacteria bacterium]
MISTTIFEQLGFSDKETAVYLALLELDSATPTDISKKSNINRTSCYDVLEGLMKKGLISKFKKKGKIYFHAGDPKRLVQYLEREREEMNKQINTQQELVKQILPELSSLIHPQSTKPKVTFYEGEKGMREAYEDTLTAKETILAYANVETMHEGLPHFFPDYYKRRTAAKVSIRAIMPKNKKSVERAKHDKSELRESVILDDPEHTFSPEVNIYNDKVLIASWKEKMAVLIESREFVQLQKLIYTLLWKTLKK